MMLTDTSKKVEQPIPLWLRIIYFSFFLISVNLLAGYVAIRLDYPSLFNVNASFWEYAIPLPFGWGMAHLPSMFIYGIPLLFLRKQQKKYTRNFRIICVCSFLILLLELDNKNPFLLYPKIDALVAFVFSLLVIPPNRKDNPVLIPVLKLTALSGIILLSLFLYSTWEHQVPKISNTRYADGIFELKSITVNNDFRKNMEFRVDMKKYLAGDQACSSAQTLASEILQDYPFDDNYEKTISIRFNPTAHQSSFESYELGEISLNSAHKDKKGRFSCYLKYKRDTEF